MTRWGILVPVGSVSVGAYNRFEIVPSEQGRQPHLGAGVNLNHDSLREGGGGFS